MVGYKCPRCGYENNIKTKFTNHLKRKKICDPLISNNNLKEEYSKYNIIEKIDSKNSKKNLSSFRHQNVTNLSSVDKKMSSFCHQNVTNLSSVDKNVSSFCHQNVIKNNYQCNFCNKILSSRQGLWRHPGKRVFRVFKKQKRK